MECQCRILLNLEVETDIFNDSHKLNDISALRDVGKGFRSFYSLPHEISALAQDQQVSCFMFSVRIFSLVTKLSIHFSHILMSVLEESGGGSFGGVITNLLQSFN
jgi:hypothetical protein